MATYFISYNKENEDWALWINEQAQGAGHETICQAVDFRVGVNFVAEIDGALKTAGAVVA